MRRSDFADLPPLVLETEGGEQEVTDYPAIAKAYAQAAADGSLNVCKWIRLAGARYLRMLELAEKPGNEFVFSPIHVVDYCTFLEKLQHTQSGLWENSQRQEDGSLNRNIILEPWQIWIESAIHGFRRTVTEERLVDTALEIVPRKSGKTERVAGAAIFDLCCGGQIGPQITLAASSASAANRVFGPIANFIGNDPDLIEQFKLKVTQDSIKTPDCGEDNGIFKLTAQGEKLDGLNPSLAIFEEGHAGAASVYRVVDSAFGARPNALRRMITTAGYRPEGPGYELMLEAQMILSGKSENYAFFAAIYTLDDEDYRDPETKAIDWDKLLVDNEHLIEKANPMYRISLDPLKIQEDMHKARRRIDLRGEAARTRFNIWTGAGMSMIDLSAWMACKRDIQLQDFFGQKCWIGVDLAIVLDLCAIVILFEVPDPKDPTGEPVIVVFAKFFLPEASPTASDPDLADQLLAWADPDQGEWLTLTPGARADHDLIESEIEMLCGMFDVQVIACDPAQAHNTINHLWDGRRPVMEFPNSARTMTAPTDDILGRIATQKIWHDGNPTLAWCASNVHGERRGNGSVVPRKESKNSKRKIDGFVATCFANGVRMQPDEAKRPGGAAPTPSAYAGNRVIGLDNIE